MGFSPGETRNRLFITASEWLCRDWSEGFGAGSNAERGSIHSGNILNCTERWSEQAGDLIPVSRVPIPKESAEARPVGHPALRVLHVLDHSVPLLSGYSVRSSNLVAAQRRMGLAPQVITG